MSVPANILSTLQADVAAILAATPALANAVIHINDEGDIEARVRQSLAPLAGTNSKRGLVLVVLPPEITEAEANLPGPQFQIRIEIQAIEHHLANRDTAKGTGITSDAACLRALSALHLHSIGAHTLHVDKNAVEPMKMPPGYGSHVATLFVRTGLDPAARVAAPEVEEATIHSPVSPIVLSGISSLTANGYPIPEGVVTSTLLPYGGLYEGFPSWGYESVSVFRQAGTWVNELPVWFFVIDIPPSNWNATWISSAQVDHPSQIPPGPWSPENPNGWHPVTVEENPEEYEVDSGGTPVFNFDPLPAFSLSSATPSASIYYTTDGSYPAPIPANAYTVPVEPTTGITYRAAAYAANMNPSNAIQFTITVPDVPLNATRDNLGDPVLDDLGSYILFT
jgi:hypothetical protein